MFISFLSSCASWLDFIVLPSALSQVDVYLHACWGDCEVQISGLCTFLTSLLYFGCSVEWLRATIHWFNLGKEIQVSSAVILDVFWAAVVVTLKLLALVSATEYKNFCTCPYFALLFFWTTFSLKVLSVYLYFLELMNVISFFSITVRCWKRAWLMSLSFTF